MSHLIRSVAVAVIAHKGGTVYTSATGKTSWSDNGVCRGSTASLKRGMSRGAAALSLLCWTHWVFVGINGGVRGAWVPSLFGSGLRLSPNTAHRHRMTRPTAAESSVMSGYQSALVAGARSRRGAFIPRHSSESNEAESGAESCEDPKSLFIFGVGYVATAVALTFRRLGWTVHGTCTDPRKVKSLGEQGIKVRSNSYRYCSSGRPS